MKEDSDQVGQITRISQLLRKAGHKSDDAVELTELIFNMASANIVSRFESKLESKLDTQNTRIDSNSARLESKIDTQNTRIDSNSARLESKIDAQNSKYNILIWAIGIGTTLIVASNFFS